MEDIKNVRIEPMGESNFLKPLRMKFTQNGTEHFWDMLRNHDSVACILFNTSRNVLVMVKQFRPVVYFNVGMKSSPDNSFQNVDWTKVPGECGVTIELCAGIVDTDQPCNEVAKREVLEECGYEVPLENVVEVTSYRNVGISGSKQTLFYAECTDEMKVSEGGGLANEGELIEVIEMTIPQLREYVNSNSLISPASMMFGCMWFLANKAPKDC